jgi:hypothetical protein
MCLASPPKTPNAIDEKEGGVLAILHDEKRE